MKNPMWPSSCVIPAGTSNELDVHNEWEENTHRHGAMAFVECLGFSQEDTMEGPLWRETLGRSLGSHDATELVGDVSWQWLPAEKPPASTPYLAQRRDGALSPTIGCSNRHWPGPFVRVKSSLWFKIHGPSDIELANETAD